MKYQKSKSKHCTVLSILVKQYSSEILQKLLIGVIDNTRLIRSQKNVTKNIETLPYSIVVL